jgi:hypothetical protein
VDFYGGPCECIPIDVRQRARFVWGSCLAKESRWISIGVRVNVSQSMLGSGPV